MADTVAVMDMAADSAAAMAATVTVDMAMVLRSELAFMAQVRPITRPIAIPRGVPAGIHRPTPIMVARVSQLASASDASAEDIAASVVVKPVLGC